MKFVILFLLCVALNLTEAKRRGDIDPIYDYEFDDEANNDDPCLTKPKCRYNCDKGLPCICECKP